MKFAICLIALFSTWIFLYRITNIVLILKDDSDCDEFVLIETDEIDVDGSLYKLEKDGSDRYFVINKTKRPLIFESQYYGAELFNPSAYGLFYIHLLQPDSIESRYRLPDYNPWEEPPPRVSVPKGTKSDIKEWIRYATDAEIKKYEQQRLELDHVIERQPIVLP